MLTERKSWYGRQGRPSRYKTAQPELKKVEFGGELEKALEVVRITQGKAVGNLLRMQVEIKNYSSTGGSIYPQT
jgi:hypothetical protein